MKKKTIALLLTAAMMAVTLTGCGDAGSGNGGNTSSGSAGNGTEYKVGIVQYVDDASLNQIVAAVQAELDAKGKELGVTFNYADYTYNGQADSTTMNQIATDLIASEVDIVVPVATPTAMVMQNATAENPKADGSLIPIVFSAVSDPVGAGLVAAMDAPGSNITGTSDALNTDAVFDLMFAANPNIDTVGLL